MGGSRCGRTSPTGGGNDVPIVLGNRISVKETCVDAVSFVDHMCPQSGTFVYVPDKVPQAK